MYMYIYIRMHINSYISISLYIHIDESWCRWTRSGRGGRAGSASSPRYHARPFVGVFQKSIAARFVNI